MPYDVTQSGPPSSGPWPAGANTTTSAIDTNTTAEWVNVGKGWSPVSDSVALSNIFSTTAAQATALVFTAPVTGLYQVVLFTAQATSTGGTLPTATVTYTDADTSAAATSTLVGTGTTTSSQGASQSALVTINAKAGTNITVNIAAPTTLTANEKARISFLG